MTNFKINKKVCTTVKMIAEDIEIGTLATVLSEPIDANELVKVSIGKSIHYFPQYVLTNVELIGGNNSFYRHKANFNEERS